MERHRKLTGMILIFHTTCLLTMMQGYGQEKTKTKIFVSKVWVSDQGDGTYINPVLHADYSDPDVIRAGEYFYMVSSSFEDVPGIPILQSRDLVNWTIIGHALPRQVPIEHFTVTRHGEGVWAPSIRFHKGEFFLYYPDPDFGIYLTKAKNASGPWSTPVLVAAGKGLIDPCPLWDDDGQAYLVHAFAGSRAGIKSLLVIKKMNAEGTVILDEGVIVFDGHESDPTIEGPKLYKRNGYYYIFAPAGGVSTGWQLVLRSKNIYGPYERKVVMDQGTTRVNGPHQGAWVTTASGENWFLHFQDMDAYGRVVHLQPMKWVLDWPVIGIDSDGDGKGEPVLRYKKPAIPSVRQTPQDSDEFNEVVLGQQWQWMANPQPAWYFMNVTRGALRLYSVKMPDSAKNLWQAPHVLLQKFPAAEFMVTTRCTFQPNPKLENEKCGLTVMGMSYSGIGLKSTKAGIQLILFGATDADKPVSETETMLTEIDVAVIYLRVKVTKGAVCHFSYSSDGIHFTEAGNAFMATPGKWKGAKVGLFCSRSSSTNDAGWADFDWFRFEPVE